MGNNRTRFPFLATLRYVVAGVVTVLTFVVVVMVIKAALRPEDIRLSILQGYIQSDTLWQQATASTTTTETDVNVVVGGSSAKASEATVTQSSHGMASDFGLGGDNTGRVVTYTYYKPVPYVNLVVGLSALNPSGRADITCGNITLRVLDMPGMVDLQTFHLPDHFTVEGQSSHTVKTMLKLDNSSALSRIADNYGGQSSFRAMVQVNATVSSKTTALQLQTTTPGKPISLYCWPVTIGSYAPSTSLDEVSCNPTDEVALAYYSNPYARGCSAISTCSFFFSFIVLSCL